MGSIFLGADSYIGIVKKATLIGDAVSEQDAG
jgi:hypothetical protein